MRRAGASRWRPLRASVALALAILIAHPVPASGASGFSSALSPPTTAPASATARPTAGIRLLVRFRPDATEAERADAVRTVGGRIDTEIPALGVTRVALPGDADDAFADGPAVAAALAAHPAVAHAELDRVVRLVFEPNDQYYPTDPFTGLGQWGIRAASVNKAWDLSRGSPAVTVAVLDTGVDPGHPDLAGALVPGTTLVSQPSSECDPTSTKDDNSHGTHVSGIIGAKGNNGAGIAGVAFGVKVMPVKTLDCTGVGELSDVASGIVYAVDHGARIVNLSLGSPVDGTTLRAAVTYATRHNVLVVSAVGNCGTLSDRCTSIGQTEYPAAYPEVLAVGATDTDDSVAFFSTQNATVDVVAPGRRIVSTTPTYKTYLSTRQANPATLTYGAFSGTSQASPFVAGLAALIWSAEPTLTVTQVFQRIETTADQLIGPAGTRNNAYGFGRVDGLRALSAAGASDRYGATYDTSAIPRSVATGRSFGARVSASNGSSFAWSAADPGAVRVAWSWLDATGAAVAGLGGTLSFATDVAVGATGTAVGPITPPSAAGSFLLRLDLVRGTTSFSSKGVGAATVAEVVGSGLGAAYAPAAATTSFDLGATATLGVSVTNTGTVAWPAAGANPVHVSYHWLQNGAVVQWDGLRASLAADVAPGAKATVAVAVMPPALPGSYTLRIDMVQEGVAWFSGLGVAPQDVAATVRSGYVATYAVSAAPVLLPGGRTSLAVTLTNTGTATWPAGGATPVHLAAHVVDAKGAVVLWDGARTALAADVAPGAAVRTTVTVDAPASAGLYRARVDAVQEGVAWFSSLGVATADTDVLVAADLRAQLPGGPLALSRAAPVAQVTIVNSGIATWTTAGAAPVDVALHWYDAAGGLLVWDGPRTALPGPVAPGASVSLAVQLGPPPAGAAFVAVDLVLEGIAWFGQGQLRPVTFVP